MATQFATMPAHAHARPTPTLKTENFDMDSFIDFNQAGPSPITASSSKTDSNPKQDWSPYDNSEDQQQQFNPPSHDYNQYKQQVGLPVGSISSIPQNGFDFGYGSAVGDMGMNSGFDAYGSGLDMDSDMNMDFNQPPQQGNGMPAMFYAAPRHQSQSTDFVNPNTIGGQEEPPSNVGRLWPGMHSQQAAMQKQMMQQQQQQQRQMKMQAFPQPQDQQGGASGSQRQQQTTSQQAPSNGKRASHLAEPHVEESISRLLNQMRQNSTVSNGSDEDGNGVLPHIARMRKDEEEMDEDERLLASEEGKKLSSKERRQLRNKVSARAFRSRRKEYISQLEGDIAMKATENQTLRNENNALANENERYRGLIETLLRHPAFHPFIDDISKNPAALGMLPSPADGMQMQPSTQPTPTPAQQVPQQQSQPESVKAEYMNFENQQPQVPPQQNTQQTQQVGLTMIPEENFSKLNINGFGQAVNFNQFQSVNAYPVTAMSDQPDHVDLIADGLPTSYLTAPASDYIPSSPTGLNLLLAKLDRTAVRTRNDA